MKPKSIIISIVALVGLSSHDMFLKLDRYFLKPNAKVTVQLFNGTFDRSENVIDRDRMSDVSVVTNGIRNNPESNDWFEQDNITFLNFETAEASTTVLGVSTLPSIIEMPGTDFNDYLKHDGVLDMLDERRKKDLLSFPAKERYSKHVKTIVQVGDSKSEDWKVNLGYPIEFIPLQNPYETKVGDSLSFNLLLRNKPLVNQLVYFGNESYPMIHTHDGNTHAHKKNEEDRVLLPTPIRTDENGNLRIPIEREGVWYLKTIHMVNLDESNLTHESNWATLTFAIGKQQSGHNAHQENQITSYYIILSLIVMVLLFMFFNRQNKKR